MTVVGHREGSRLNVAKRRLLPVGALVAVAIMLVSGPAAAQAAQQMITSPGPLTSIYLNDDLGCQVQAAGDTSPSFFGDTNPGACGTFLAVTQAGAVSPTLFGPRPPAGVTPDLDFTPAGQSLSGNGTAASPFTVVSTVTANTASGILLATIVETDTYVTGQDFYTTSLQITNSFDGTLVGTLYHAGDCFLANQDTGFGALGAGNSPECTINPNNSPSARFMAFSPVGTPDFPTSAANYFESGFSTVWDNVTNAGTQFPNTVDPTTNQDNGMGLSWALNLAFGRTAHVLKFTTAVSPNSPPASSTSVAGGCLPSGQIPITVSAVNGPAQVNYVVNGGAEQSLPTDAAGNATIGLASPGYYTVEFWGQDQSGSQEATHHSVTVTVASGSPGLTITSDQGKSSYVVGEPASVTIAANGPGLTSDPSAAHAPISTATAGSFTVSRTAANACGTTNATFAYTTVVALPALTPGSPVVSSTTSAAFTATVNPEGLATSVHFEYGPSLGGGAAAITYGSATPDKSVGPDFANHTVTATVTGLLPNVTYHVRAVATNSAGSTPGADQTFKTPADPPPPPPVLGKLVNMTPISGVVFIKLPPGAKLASLSPSVPVQAFAALTKGQGFVPLTEARQLPVGTQVDARQGTVRLVSASTRRHQTYSGDFQSGLFRTLQSRSRRALGLTTLQLLENAFPGAPSFGVCARAGKAQAASVDATAARRLSSHVIQLLHANVHGRFQTRGRYSAATVRGTQWTMEDRCDGTLTKVRRGTVIVHDFRRRVNIAVHAGKSYLARAR